MSFALVSFLETVLTTSSKPILETSEKMPEANRLIRVSLPECKSPHVMTLNLTSNSLGSGEEEDEEEGRGEEEVLELFCLSLGF